MDRADYVEFYLEANNSSNHTDLRTGTPLPDYSAIFTGGVCSNGEWRTWKYGTAASRWDDDGGANNTNIGDNNETRSKWGSNVGTFAGGYWVNAWWDLTTLGQNASELSIGLDIVVKDNAEDGLDRYDGYANDNNRVWFAGFHDTVGNVVLDMAAGDNAKFTTFLNESKYWGEAVPEPGTMCLLALGGIGALLKRRRKA